MTRLTEMQTWAQDMVGTEVAAGRLHRLPCETCNKPNTQAHHDDYARPLDVRWLCVSCHRRWHWHNKAANRDGAPPRTKRGQSLVKSLRKPPTFVWRGKTRRSVPTVSSSKKEIATK